MRIPEYIIPKGNHAKDKRDAESRGQPINGTGLRDIYQFSSDRIDCSAPMFIQSTISPNKSHVWIAGSTRSDQLEDSKFSRCRGQCASAVNTGQSNMFYSYRMTRDVWRPDGNRMQLKWRQITCLHVKWLFLQHGFSLFFVSLTYPLNTDHSPVIDIVKCHKNQRTKWLSTNLMQIRWFISFSVIAGINFCVLLCYYWTANDHRLKVNYL